MWGGAGFLFFFLTFGGWAKKGPPWAGPKKTGRRRPGFRGVFPPTVGGGEASQPHGGVLSRAEKEKDGGPPALPFPLKKQRGDILKQKETKHKKKKKGGGKGGWGFGDGGRPLSHPSRFTFHCSWTWV